MVGSFAYEWDELTEQQQTARLDQVLDEAGDFYYITARDSYRIVGSMPRSADWCPAQAVEQRRRYRDRRRDR
jgi:hypothetical protein